MPFKIMLVPTSLKSAKNSLISLGVTGIERKIKAEKNVRSLAIFGKIIKGIRMKLRLRFERLGGFFFFLIIG